MKDVVEQLKKDPGSVKWGGGYSEFAEYIATGKMKPVGVTSPSRLKGVDVPTPKEQGIDAGIGNWRGVYGASGLTPAQRKATQSKAWAEALEKNRWTSAMLAGVDFDKFVETDFAKLRATMVKAGMV